MHTAIKKKKNYRIKKSCYRDKFLTAATLIPPRQY
jgi:hypothetical protein